MSYPANRKAIQSLIPSLESLCVTMWSGTTIGTRRGGVMSFLLATGVVNLDEKAVKSLNALVKEIMSSDVGQNYSSSYIERQVQSIARKLAGLPAVKIKSAIESEIKTLIDTLTQSQFQEDRITFPVSGVRVWPHLFVAKAGRCWIYSLANHKEHKWLGMVASGRRVSHVLKFQPPGGSQYWIKTTVRAAPDDSEKRENSRVQYIQESLGLLMLFSVLENLATIFLPQITLNQDWSE